jgi:hypothetical protein
MIFLRNRTAIVLSIVYLVMAACSNKSTPVPAPTIVKEWNIALSAKYENPAPAGRNETGTVNLQLLSDNSLKYTIAVNGLTAGDNMTAAHLHAGDAITSGPVILGLDPVFTAGSATGIVKNLRTSLIDSLKSSTNEIYFNAHSTQVASGLVRGQLNTNIEVASDVILNSANEVPAGTSAATGLALVRLTSEKKVYIKLTVTGLEAGDVLNAAHIHKAATGVNGPVILGFYSSAADFGTVKIITVDDPLYTSLKTDAIYVNAHSTVKPGGIIRGQIR